jgi:hypothetical protein
MDTESKSSILANGVSYESNSNKYHLEQKKVEKVIEGNVKTKEKGLFSKLGETFLSEDASKVKSYILTDVIIPAVKDTIVDIVKNGIDMIFYGEPRADRSKQKGGGTYVSYNSYYNPSSRSRTTDTRDRDRSRSNSREFIFDSRGEAEKVLDTLFDLVEEYKAASVADLCSLVGVTGEWTDNKWGWLDLKGSSVKRVHGGYILDLPRPIYLD